MKLYSYWRSTTSVRVRAALNLKGVAYELIPVNLVEGQQKSADYNKINPAKGVPSLVLDDGTILTQSMAILNWIETNWPEPALLPNEPNERALAEAASHAIALDIHPVNNLRILEYLKQKMGHSQDETVDWMKHWMHEGFSAFDALIKKDTDFCFADQPGLADLCLVGQMVNARRWGLELEPFGRLVEIDQRARQIPAIEAAMPENQPDAQPT